jgi:hypothetical protein
MSYGSKAVQYLQEGKKGQVSPDLLAVNIWFSHLVAWPPTYEKAEG